jgi:hypothetical protein
MFEPSSRYVNCERAKFITENGYSILYIKRRELPSLIDESIQHSGTIIVSAGDRLDNIAAQTIGDPEQFWRICDINKFMHPFDLTREPGTELQIPIPGSLILGTK